MAQFQRPVSTYILLVFFSLASVLTISPLISDVRTDAVMTNAEYRTIDGSGNNQANPRYGTTNTQLIRVAEPPAYENGISIPRTKGVNNSDLPNPRSISNVVASQLENEDRPNITNTTNMVFQWGQFLDHDIDLTEGKEEYFPIIVPNDDEVFPSGSNIPLQRSIFDPTTGTGTDNPRQQINEITTWIDASNVYGSDENLASSLREGKCGLLKKSKNFNLLPADSDGNFIAGDIRAREQTGLVAMHTLFMREHNRLANIMCKQHKKDPSWNDEKIYQETRKYVAAQMQVITYKEFLPILLGSGALPNYSGYNQDIDPSISNEFSTAAFRFGHSTLTKELWLLKKNGKPIPYGNLPLADAFFRPNKFLYPNTLKGIEPVMRGLVQQPHMGVDNMIVDGVRNFLFGSPGAGGLDLASLNIQRGRDHGLPDYNTVRIALGLTKKNSFDEISSQPNINAKLASVYDSPDDIDLWVGGLAEDPVNGGLVGETFHAIIKDQFIRLRDGDRFWYQKPGVFTTEQLEELNNTTLRDVISRNTKVTPNEVGASAFKL
ncbi:MAG: peroxidase family protein [Calothrix sp. MO_167.B12]|nr:peroxidase family protein [Calothrix sp. MO_167.B12]